MEGLKGEIATIKKRIRELEWKIDLYSNFPFSNEIYDPNWEIELLGLKEALRYKEGQLAKDENV